MGNNASYDPGAFPAHIASLAQADKNLVDACKIAAGRTANWRATCRSLVQNAAAAGQEMAPSILAALDRGDEEAAARSFASLQSLFDVVNANADGLSMQLVSATFQNGQTEAACMFARWAAAQGNLDAVLFYSNRLSDGPGVRANPAAAAIWVRHGAENNHLHCQFNLALSYAKTDAKTAAQWYTRAAQGGLAEAQVNLGMCYEQGLGVPKNLTTALSWYEKAALQNHPKGIENAANCHNHGWGCPKDLAAGARWLRHGAENGVPVAQARLANCYENGEGVEQSWPEAVRWYRAAAEQGEVISQFNLGNCYAEGWGVEVDMMEAARWYGRAALQGLPQASMALTRRGLPMLDEDTLMGRTDEEAYAAHLAAAQAGDAEEMYIVGVYRLQGRGVKRDFAEGLRWLKQASDAGAGEATRRLGDLHGGILPGLPELDGVEALRLYDKAEAANVDCTTSRVEIYLKGRPGVPRDAAQALKLLRNAFARSHVIPVYKAVADLVFTMHGDHEAGSKEASDAAAASGRADSFNMSMPAVRLCHYYYALMHDFGFGVPQNKELAQRHYAGSADRVPLAQARLTEFQLQKAAAAGPVTFSSDNSNDTKGPRVGFRTRADGAREFVTDPPGNEEAEAALKTYAEAAEAGDEEGMYFLASCYERGALGVDEDLRMAKELYAAAAAKGLWWAEQAVSRCALLKEKTFTDIMTDGPLVTKAPGQPAQIADLLKNSSDVIALYFSAHWCGPCRGFTPKLAEAYNKWHQEGATTGGEVLFCSLDKTEDEFNEYHATMPWPALPFGDPRIKELAKLLQIGGIPSLITITPEGKVLNAEADDEVRRGTAFPWNPAPLPALLDIEDERTVAALNKHKIIIFDAMKAADEAAQAVFVATVTKLHGQRDPADSVHGMVVPYVPAAATLSDEAARKCPEDHDLTEQSAEAVEDHTCDVCQIPIETPAWCCKECDYDRCLACFTSKRAPAPRFLRLVNSIREVCKVVIDDAVSGPVVYAISAVDKRSAVLIGAITEEAVTKLAADFYGRTFGPIAVAKGETAATPAAAVEATEESAASDVTTAAAVEAIGETGPQDATQTTAVEASGEATSQDVAPATAVEANGEAPSQDAPTAAAVPVPEPSAPEGGQSQEGTAQPPLAAGE